LKFAIPLGKGAQPALALPGLGVGDLDTLVGVGLIELLSFSG
jgi:hypothetical protein